MNDTSFVYFSFGISYVFLLSLPWVAALVNFVLFFPLFYYSGISSFDMYMCGIGQARLRKHFDIAGVSNICGFLFL